MCVAVTLLPGATLTEEETFKMNRANADGCGIAWARGDWVHWVKTTKVNPSHVAQVLEQYIAYPRLVHFRVATVGGTRPELCHPFEIGPTANCRPVGKAGRVMIHNGHYSKWDELKTFLEAEHLLPDKGPWSDTRLIAYMAHQDVDWLQVIGGRVAVLDGDGQLYHIGDWSNHREGVRVSNFFWQTRDYQVGGYSGYRQWPGWQNSEEDWENWAAAELEAEERELAALEAAAAESRKIIEIKEHVNASKDKEDAEREERAREAQRAKYDVINDKIAARDARKTYRPGRAYDDQPWTSPTTGKTYQVNQNGTVFEIAPEATNASDQG